MDNETHAALRATSNEGLIQALLILTHRVHAAEATEDSALPNPPLPGETWTSAHRAANELREQRCLVRDEVLRRMTYGYRGPHA